MLKQVLLFVVLFIGTQAYAEDCPAFYRFVDFGTYDNTGVLRRGGTVFRAFAENGDPLLQVEKTACMTVAEVSRDGRQLPIPIVSHIEIDMDVASLDFSSLTLDAVDNVAGAAEENAQTHRETLAVPTSETVRGNAYLCVSAPEKVEVSCQMVPPYGTAALVIYCDAQSCEMPLLELGERVVARATWPRIAADADTIALDALSRLQTLDQFLDVHL